jgi:hypothetical protein
VVDFLRLISTRTTNGFGANVLSGFVFTSDPH